MLYLLRYGEVFLKTEYVMQKMVRLIVRDLKTKFRERNISSTITAERGRIFVSASEEVSELLKKTFGIVSFSPVIAELQVNSLESFFKEKAEELLENSSTFAVRVKRVGNHPFTSKEMEEKLGSILAKKAKVDLEKPEKEIFVEIRGEKAYIFTQIIKGPGGLPAASSSRLLVLLSSGIDSPVAAWLMAKRGAQLNFLHFLRGRYGPDDRKKTIELVKRIREWYPYKVKLYFLTHEKNLQEFVKYAPYTCILCKRMMLRLASLIAKHSKSLGIVTGDSLGEVASQTLENLKLESEVVSLPIYRPLIGMDKDEIIKLAKKIGTYEVSISERDYCLAVPKKPKTKAKEEEIERIEKKLNIEALISETWETLEVVKI